MGENLTCLHGTLLTFDCPDCQRERFAAMESKIAALEAELAALRKDVATVGAGDEGPPPCRGCGGPHQFDTSVPSPAWNRVIRGGGLPDYLCTSCILKAFALTGESFVATLWGADLNGVPVEFQVNSKAANCLKETEQRLLDQIGGLRNDAEFLQSRLAPVQAELDEAVELLRDALETEHLFDWRLRVRAFLARHQRDNAQGEGGWLNANG